MCVFSQYSGDLTIVLVEYSYCRYSAGEIPWRHWYRYLYPTVPVSGILPVLLAGTYRHYWGTTAVPSLRLQKEEHVENNGEKSIDHKKRIVLLGKAICPDCKVRSYTTRAWHGDATAVVLSSSK